MASTSTEPQTQHILHALVAVAGELAKLGITKGRVNEAQHFRFRGIDDVLNAVSPILSKHEVVFLPCYTDYPDVERATSDGRKALIYSKVRGDYTFVSARDASQVTVTTFGVAMDSGDKAVNKAMSAALKYALLQTFLIPTESSEDADADSPEASVLAVPAPPSGFEAWFAALLASSEDGLSGFRNMFRKGSEAQRAYAETYRKAEGAAAKQRAMDVTEEHAAKDAAELA